MNIIRILHPFKFGDLLTILPGIKHLHDTTGSKSIIYQRLGMPAYFDNNEDQCMTLSMFKMLKPLIEHQDYIESYEIWEGEKVDIDTTPSKDSRVVPLPNGSIHHWLWAIVPEMQCNLFIPWIEAEPKEDKYLSNKILINRTSRYTNPYVSYFFLKKHQDKLLFTGTTEEYEKFSEDYKLEMPHLKPNNFLELAEIIKTCRFILSNQSGIWHIADGMKTPRLLECSTTYPNTYPTGSDGYFFLHQKSLEMLFEKLLKI